MKKTICWVLLAALAAPAAALELAPAPHQAQAAALSADLLSRFHYRTPQLDDALSERIFERYLKSLDPEKYFFDQADLAQLAPLRTRLDDAIRDQQLAPAFGIFNLYTQRAVERYGYARSLLKAGFDFSRDESFQISRDKADWPRNESELAELWRKRVKNDWLRLRLAGKDDRAIVETLERRYDAAIRRIERLKGEDAFQAFMNAYTTAIEPHTNYLGPRASENFDISMRLSLVGIGAVLQERDEYTTVREVTAGGPAALSGQLKPGDRIVGVGQGADGPLVDVTGWRLDDTVRLIRGESDTVVVLDILPADAGAAEQHKLLKLVRKKISLEEQSAKKSLIPLGEGGRRIGVISLPSFYLDFAARQQGDPAFKSATRDVERLLGELKREKVDGLVIDLRGNGGGSLLEAIELTGLFIDQGPVVQQRDARGKIAVESDKRPGTAWDGPLAVLIDRQSASASEIFAAAIQDYGRGLIVGEPSYGKGTVQTLLDLDRIGRNPQHTYGELKVTIAQFFRINGGTTQLRGVTPDIRFPDDGGGDSQREAAFDNALPWTAIAAAEHPLLRDLQPELPALRNRHEQRLKQDPELRARLADLAEIARLRRDNRLSLNEAERRREREAQEKREAQRRPAGGKPGTADDGLLADERPIAGSTAGDAGKEPDPLLAEAARILGDELALRKAAERPSVSRR